MTERIAVITSALDPIAIGAAGLAALLAVAGIILGVRAIRRAQASGEDKLTWLAASIATVVSMQGMWQFVERTIHIHWTLRLLIFAFIEVAVITSAVRARRNMRENYSAGIDGMAVWAGAGLSAVLSSMEARSLPEALFRLAAPLVAAWLWERGMAIERRRTLGRARIHWRVTPERILVRLGLAEASDRTAGEVDTQRRLTRVALAAKRVRDLQAAAARPRRLAAARRRLERAYTAAASHTSLARDEQLQRALGAEVAVLYDAEALVRLAPASAWSPAVEPTGYAELAAETRHLADLMTLRGDLARIAEDARNAVANAAMIGSLVSGERLHPAHGNDRVGDQATAVPRVVIPAPRRRLAVDPGSPWPVGHRVPLITWRRPDTRPAEDGVLPPLLDAEPDPPGDDGRDSDASGQRPGADRKTPSEEDNRRVRRSLRASVVRWKKPLPSKRDLADAEGFSETWAWTRIQEVRQRLVGEGWRFGEDGAPVAPPDVVKAVNGSHGGDS